MASPVRRVAPKVYFPNWVWRLKLTPVRGPGVGDKVAETEKYKEGGAFKTTWIAVETRNQEIGKLEMRSLLEKVYGLEVAEVRSLNVMGKRRRVVVRELKKTFEKKMPDLKKFYVRIKEEAEVPWNPEGVPKVIERMEQLGPSK